MSLAGPERPFPRVHVVTPAHNEERFIAQAIESVLAQDYPNWEMTVVNNGSTDRTLEIARGYAARDPRVRVHDNEVFLSQLENINSAFERVPPEADYCHMVLGDDWIYPRCMSEMVRVAESSESIALVSAYRATEHEILGSGLPRDRSCFQGREVCARQLLHGHFYFGSPTAQLWRASVVRERRPFFRSDFHPDTDACYDVLAGWDFGFVHDVLTFRRSTNESVSSRVRAFNAEFVDGLVMLANYGSRYLEPAERARLWRKMFPVYRRFIGESFLRRESPEFWAHHRLAMSAMGLDLTRATQAAWAARWVIDLLLNPKRTTERVVEGLRRRARR